MTVFDTTSAPKNDSIRIKGLQYGGTKINFEIFYERSKSFGLSLVIVFNFLEMSKMIPVKLSFCNL
jgi:hypothetical protein